MPHRYLEESVWSKLRGSTFVLKLLKELKGPETLTSKGKHTEGKVDVILWSFFQCTEKRTDGTCPTCFYTHASRASPTTPSGLPSAAHLLDEMNQHVIAACPLEHSSFLVLTNGILADVSTMIVMLRLIKQHSRTWRDGSVAKSTLLFQRT